ELRLLDVREEAGHRAGSGLRAFEPGSAAGRRQAAEKAAQEQDRSDAPAPPRQAKSPCHHDAILEKRGHSMIAQELGAAWRRARHRSSEAIMPTTNSSGMAMPRKSSRSRLLPPKAQPLR